MNVRIGDVELNTKTQKKRRFNVIIKGAELYLKKTLVFEVGDKIVGCHIKYPKSVNPAIEIPEAVVKSGNYRCSHNTLEVASGQYKPTSGLIFLGGNL